MGSAWYLRQHSPCWKKHFGQAICSSTPISPHLSVVTPASSTIPTSHILLGGSVCREGQKDPWQLGKKEVWTTDQLVRAGEDPTAHDVADLAAKASDRVHELVMGVCMTNFF
jgi:hypothetical protein